MASHLQGKFFNHQVTHWPLSLGITNNRAINITLSSCRQYQGLKLWPHTWKGITIVTELYPGPQYCIFQRWLSQSLISFWCHYVHTILLGWIKGTFIFFILLTKFVKGRIKGSRIQDILIDLGVLHNKYPDPLTCPQWLLLCLDPAVTSLYFRYYTFFDNFLGERAMQSAVDCNK